MERVNVKDFGERILAWNTELSLASNFLSFVVVIVNLTLARRGQAKGMKSAAVLEQGPIADGYNVHLTLRLPD